MRSWTQVPPDITQRPLSVGEWVFLAALVGLIVAALVAQLPTIGGL